MKQHLILSLLATLIYSCKTNPKIDYVSLSGKAENAQTDKIVITNGHYKKELTIGTEGTFSDTLKLSETGFYTLSIGRERTYVYLKNGDNLNLTLDAYQFDETLSFTGEGSDENNYLVAKQLNIEKYTSNSQEFYSLDETSFKARVDSLKTFNASLLEANSNIDPDFVSIETKNLVYDSYSLLNNYKDYHGRYADIENYEVPENFLPKELKNLDFTDAEAYRTSTSYKKMAFNGFLNDLFDEIGDDYLYATTDDLKSVSTIEIPDLKNDVAQYLGTFLVSPGNPNMQSVYEFFISNANSNSTKEKITEVYNKGKDLAKGKPSPQFSNYENHKGGDLSLSDLKGKYVYIDVWATWCGPCKREIPSLKMVEQQFHGKNIEFVSTSIDVANDHDKWVAMVNEMSLGGTQLFADNDWNSQFIKDYGIEGIPRFILLDPDGNIVSADAPRPSNPRLVELLNSLDI